VTEQERLAAGLRYLEQQKKADPLESFRSFEGLKGVYERRVQPIINNAMQTFETGGAVGDLLRAYGSAAAPANAAVLEGMGMPYRGPMTAPRQEGVSGGENFRAMGDPRQQAVGQMIGDPANLAQPVGARLANALKFAKPDAMKMVQEMSRGAMSPMDVWHGSPHRFAPTAKNPLGEFDSTKIGTGEGAQAYGMGHYLSEAPSVAETYKSAVDPAARSAFMHLQKNNGNVKQTIQEVTKDLKNYEKNQQFLMPNVLNQTKQKLDYLKMQKTGKPIDIGSLYKVDLPDEVVPRMLDWDKPLSQQNWYRPVADVVKEYKGAGKDVDAYARLISKANARGGEVTGGQFYDGMLSQFGGSQTKVSEFMREAGIPGIQYLDAGSRSAGTGTRNYVVFPGNEGLLNILGRE